MKAVATIMPEPKCFMKKKTIGGTAIRLDRAAAIGSNTPVIHIRECSMQDWDDHTYERSETNRENRRYSDTQVAAVVSISIRTLNRDIVWHRHGDVMLCAILNLLCTVFQAHQTFILPRYAREEIKLCLEPRPSSSRSKI